MRHPRASTFDVISWSSSNPVVCRWSSLRSGARKQLERRDRVCEIAAGRHERRDAQAPSAEIRRPRLLRILAAEQPVRVTASVHHIRLPRQQRRDHRHVVLRFVFEIGVLNHQVVAGRALDARSHCPALAAVALVTAQDDIGKACDDLRRCRLSSNRRRR